MKFLKDRGFLVFGADRIAQEEDIKGTTRFFKLNLRHRDSIWLMFNVVKPHALVYCAIARGNRGNYGTFFSVLSMAIKFGIKKVMVIVTKPPIHKKPKDLLEIEELAIVSATQLLAKKHDFKHDVVTQGDNLLKKIKRFLKERSL